jgi:hypothetical protein
VDEAHVNVADSSSHARPNEVKREAQNWNGHPGLIAEICGPLTAGHITDAKMSNSPPMTKRIL